MGNLGEKLRTHEIAVVLMTP
jgi:hypothetical protein